MSKKNKFTSYFLTLLVSISLVLSSPSLLLAQNADNIRGVEIEEAKKYDPKLSALSAGLYIPKQITNATLYGAAKGAKVVSDPDFIKKVEDILYLYKRELAWFPTFSWTSGGRPNYGGGLYYKKSGFKALTRFSVNDSNYWSLKAKTSYSRYIGSTKWKTSLVGVYEKRDDRKYYGLGSAPLDDPRNLFFGPKDHGVFSEERRKLQWSSSLFPDPRWGVTYMGYYQRRSFDPFGIGDDDLQDVFRLSTVPGFTNGPVTQVYNELALEMDTRNKKKIISPGWRGEVYTGISAGLDANKSDFIRYGADLAAFIPVIKNDRILVPRIVFNGVDEFDNDDPIPFTEFSRHRTFRGVSDRELIRNDKLSLVPSLEYQWPLSHILSGHVFIDSLIVGPKVSEMGWDDFIWAAGAGVDFHFQNREWGRAQFAMGSEGFQFKFTVGKPLQKNSRADWK